MTASAANTKELLPHEEIHVWSCPLLVSPPVLEVLYRLLASDERNRASRFHFAKHRNAFIVRRAFLRLLLSRYTLMPAPNIRFTYGSRGKPSLSSDCQADSPATPLHFNLSHSGDLALYALAAGSELGVDVEELRAIGEARQIAKNFFSAVECAELAAVPSEQQSQAFLHCWTRKEAFLKALGDGLSIPLNLFEVSLTPALPATLGVSGLPRQKGAWALYDLRLAPGYVGALVCRRPDRQVRTCGFQTADEAAEEFTRWQEHRLDGSPCLELGVGSPTKSFRSACCDLADRTWNGIRP